MQTAKYLKSIGVNIKESKKMLKRLDYTINNTRRICLHNNNSKDLQVMIIEFKANSIFPKHKHTNKEEVLIAIEGYCDIIHSSDKEEEGKTRLSREDIFICFNRINEEHKLIIGDEGFMCVEISQGKKEGIC